MTSVETTAQVQLETASPIVIEQGVLNTVRRGIAAIKPIYWVYVSQVTLIAMLAPQFIGEALPKMLGH